MKPLVFDSTPLIYLTRVSLAGFLKELAEEKFTPLKVFVEVVEEGKRRGVPEASVLESLFKEDVIHVRNPADDRYLKSVKDMAAESERQPLHEGEAEVLCLVKELNGVAIVDDKVARSVARLLGVEVHGTGFILGKILVAGKIGKEELLEKVKAMRELGWYVSAEDYLSIIEYLKSLSINGLSDGVL
jgi:predicted nucleic acid-binding protein